jgi:dipeptidyl aminopeptidase/acylaminoacyl peptidase
MKNKVMNAQLLWQCERLGRPSLSPIGTQLVASLSSYEMEGNKSSSALWLLSTEGKAPKRLTHTGDKDGQPLWSPRGDRIAFLAKREQEGSKDEESQLYVMAADGGEARRVATVATGVEAFRWFPDGKRIAFVSWVWPKLSGTTAQAKAHKAFKERKETGYATSEALYRYWDHNLPLGRVPHLHIMDVDSGKFSDLFEGTAYELSRTEPDANTFDIAPDGSAIVFAFDPANQKRMDNRFALVELSLGGSKPGKFKTIAQDADWDFAAPSYSPDGNAVAFLASHQGKKHTMPAQLAVWQRKGSKHQVVSAQWDTQAEAPLLWDADGSAVLLTAEQRGHRHLWRFHLAEQRAEMVVEGGWVQGFDQAGDTLVTLADAMLHPARMQVHRPGQAARRIERFNDALLKNVDLGSVEEVWFKGAAPDASSPPDDVQMWLIYPPGFDAKKKYPLLHVIHGGPHTASGDTWHYRWNNPTFAAQGYVVASVNYHGSTSFGYRFTDSITHRWGALELQDIERATDVLLKKPWADKHRIFASGGSYGGYMVAWMNGHIEPGRYQAYVCHAGCFDWTAMFADDAYTWFGKELGALYWDDPAKVAAQSPVTFAGNMKTPTLVIHGALDYRVPDAQGLAYYNTLQARQVDTRLLWFPDENHWVMKPRNSQLWYGEFFAWLSKHDKKPGARAN